MPKKPTPYSPPYIYNATVLGNHDGDTITVRIDLGRRVQIEEEIRVYGVNCPEMSTGKPGDMAKRFVEQWLRQFKTIVVCTRRDKSDKYGRLLATIFGDASGVWHCLNTMLVWNGHATPYLVKSESELAETCVADLERIIKGSLK